jgi:hypothetical protein
MATGRTSRQHQDTEYTYDHSRRPHGSNSLPSPPSTTAGPSIHDSLASTTTILTARVEQTQGTHSTINNFQSYAELDCDAAGGYMNTGPPSVDNYGDLPPNETLRRWSSLKISAGGGDAGPTPKLERETNLVKRAFIRDGRVLPSERTRRDSRPRIVA